MAARKGRAFGLAGVERVLDTPRIHVSPGVLMPSVVKRLALDWLTDLVPGLDQLESVNAAFRSPLIVVRIVR